MVFAHHTMSVALNRANPLDILSQEAHIGVSIFFILSGCLIGVRYSNSFTGRGLLDWKQYLLYRFARIYPAYLACTLLALLYKPNAVGVWLVNILVLQGFFDEISFTGIGIGWSLTVEICFYTVAPLVLYHWSRLGLLGWTIVTLLTGGALVALGQVSIPYTFMPDLNFMIRSTFFGRCLEFYLGIWLSKKLFTTSSATFLFSYLRNAYTYAGVAGILICMFLMAYVRGEVPGALPSKQLFLFNGINNYVLPWCIGSLIFGLVREKTFIRQLLSSRICQECGKGSYLFYLIHFKLGVSLLYGQLWPNRTGVFLLMVLLSITGYYLVEAPMHKKLRQLFSTSRISETKSI